MSSDRKFRNGRKWRERLDVMEILEGNQKIIEDNEEWKSSQEGTMEQ